VNLPFSWRSREPAAAPPTSIEDVAADWLARREAGLSVDEQAEFSRWLLADAAHANAVRRLEATWRWLKKPRCTGQADEVARAVELRVAQRARRTRRRRLAGVGLGTLATAAALVVGFLPAPPSPPESSRVAASVTLKPERRPLADGSVVELNAGAEIEVDFSVERRDVRLVRGVAHFAVARDPARPFVVTAGLVAVRAVGTEFVVQFAPGEVDVLVTEGRVAVERVGEPVAAAPASDNAERGVNSGSWRTYLDAGSRVTVPTTSAPAALLEPSLVTAAQVQAALAWRGMRVEFSNTPLAEIVRLFNRQNRVQLALGADDLGTICISGIFWADDPEGFSRLLEISAGLRAERSATGVITLRH
jgi:transmembrane sensor